MRYHFMDSMRAAMMVAGVFYHAALVYSPGVPWRFNDPSDIAAFDWLANFLHAFRMPAFFAVAGFFCALTFARDTSIRKLYARLAILGVPFFAMMFTFQPLQYALKLDGHGSFHGLGEQFWHDYFVKGEFIGHLWFLINLVLYTLAAWIIVRLPAAARTRDYFGSKAMACAFTYKTLMSLVALVFCVPGMFLVRNLALGDEYDLQWFFQYAPFFVVGYIVFKHAHLFAEFRRVKLVDILIMALLLIAERHFDGRTGHLLGLLSFFQCGFVLTGVCVLLFTSSPTTRTG